MFFSSNVFIGGGRFPGRCSSFVRWRRSPTPPDDRDVTSLRRRTAKQTLNSVFLCLLPQRGAAIHHPRSTIADLLLSGVVTLLALLLAFLSFRMFRFLSFRPSPLLSFPSTFLALLGKYVRKHVLSRENVHCQGCRAE